MSRLRIIAKLVRFSTEEIARVGEHAQSCGYTSARYIRETALGAIPKARHHADRDALLLELARIGRDLERLARLVEAAGIDQFCAGDRTQLRSALSAHHVALRRLVGECGADARVQ